ITAMIHEANGFMEGEGKDMVKAAALMDEFDALQKEYDLEERMFKAAKAGVPTGAGEPAATGTTDAIKAFADAARAGFKQMNEGTGADGGYNVPQDIRTRINKYKEERGSLARLVDREAVTTMSGRRTYQSRAQHTGFTLVAEGGKIPKVATPKFDVLAYTIKKYAGYLPVTNELLKDSDANIANVLIEWLGGEEIATENTQIIAAVNQKEATAMTGINDIKKAINVTLAAFAGSVRIVTNSDGLQYLDTLEDANGRPLLSPDPTKPMQMRLSVGARSIPIEVFPNAVLPTGETGAIPFIVGDLYEYMKLFDREQLSITVSDVAVAGEFNAFENDMTLFRGIMRADFVPKDTEAIVRGELTPAAD
ncbi:MAG: phage major capsid protein, partial [Butyricicoccus sp.]|nr:phage major capsid protein [Butyricicoccus sp.]